MKVASGALLVLLVAGCAASHPAAPAPVGSAAGSLCAQPPGRSTQVAVTIDGVARSVLVHPPTAAGPAPVVVALHGYGGSGLELQIASKLSVAADARGWLVVYPEGTGTPPGWTDNPAGGGHAADLAFLKRIIGELTTGGCGDSRRVIITGMSQGAWLSDMAGCELADVVTAVVAVAGRDMGWPCPTAHPVAFAAVNGVLDQVLPYDGGPVNVAAPVATVQSVEQWTSQRAQQRNCGEPTRTSPSPHVVAIIWSGCSAPMQLYRLEDGGHTWPQSDGVGSIDQEFSVTDLIASMLNAAPSR